METVDESEGGLHTDRSKLRRFIVQTQLNSLIWVQTS